ncbi:MAG TPA: glucose 1-dehydrogenase [Flavobacteriales bacterium]|nr:glucose 1-dehydrogenase [Flavobacteriales bacterium]HRP82012.1 glucose 1-dehydrogenase [Flavobacteriales bacterium]
MKNKTVIVTGAGSGIGRAVALKFARGAANVVVADVHEAEGKRTVQQVVEQGGNACFVMADTSRPADCANTVQQALERFGALHCAVNNAGIGGAGVKTADYPLERWEREIAVNLSGVFYGMRYQIAAMLEGGGGAIVNIASVLGVTAIPLSAAYIAAKHGVVGLTKAAALEYAQQGIRVNAVGPGYTETPLLAKYDEARLAGVLARHPMGRLARPEEIANMVHWLCTDEASYVTGAYLPADGGYTAQ